MDKELRLYFVMLVQMLKAALDQNEGNIDSVLDSYTLYLITKLGLNTEEVYEFMNSHITETFSPDEKTLDKSLDDLSSEDGFEKI